ncbi:Integrin Cytoplasmic domain-Associated Protein homolog [Caenorhabditis elegans]|uniref:Integrin Cytoplasmic domain-Associated Protein homolog n=2 Tax=Caenorhabditis elegans TaxID=6239 RepID=O62480_CAEEL|nr:Integrin Cytoplasmic domain-Associated Protein homolog [Caenorhabditis elegans]CAA16385.2 Integrin Cytoplasmic domain-Associated Protein homolog [Caenorhabditis elegans]|eukprot:NP_001255757.1 Integrin Cytoplasmic domain-Associated Protein homolog [Caenorhabditis elegans]
MTDPKISALYVAVQEINSLIQNGTSCSRSLEEKIVEHLENSQLLGKLPKNNGDSHEEVYMEVTKHGLRISSRRTRLVKLRIPLIELILLTTYADGFGRTNIVFVEKSTTTRYQLHLLQATDDASSNILCNLVKNAFIEAEEASALIEVIEPPSPSIA